MDWWIREEGFDPDRITLRGNKFLVGNGYLGIRGTPPEYEKEQYPAINLAGVYDQAGEGWRETVNAPNGLYAYVVLNGAAYRLPGVYPERHHTSLNYRQGIFACETSYITPAGRLTVRAERFASLSDCHLIVMKYAVRLESGGRTEVEGYLAGGGRIRLVTGIDGDVWEINGPHFKEMHFYRNNDAICAKGITHESGGMGQIVVYEACQTDNPCMEDILLEGRKYLRVLTFPGSENEITLYKYISVYTGFDKKNNIMEAAYETVEKAKSAGYSSALLQHKKAWEDKWALSEITIEGDDKAMEALNYSIYHLHCIAPRHADNLSIAARGLSGQTYKGAVFWDTEMFMLDFFLLTEPYVAKSLIRYRINTLDGARKKAREYGYGGAFYAWESQDGGFDACSDYNVIDVFTGRKQRTYFRDKQIHISSAIVYGIMRYIEFTGDHEILIEGGAEVILECALFYYDLLIKRVSREKYELHDVIGPDEYHERVNNNAYTNRMAKYTFDSAIKVIEYLIGTGHENAKNLMREYDLKRLPQIFLDASDKLYIPQPDPDTGIIEQFDGYMKLEDVSLEELTGRMLHEKEYLGGANGIAAHTKIIKQADVVTMLNLFSREYDREILQKNWEYYEPRTEHGSSLSACMYAILACKCGLPDLAYPHFMKSASADLNGRGKEWAGLIYIGGTHPASSGGAYKTAVEGFAGIHIKDGELAADPRLPACWTRMEFKVVFRGELYLIDIRKTYSIIQKIETA